MKNVNIFNANDFRNKINVTTKKLERHVEVYNVLYTNLV